jgi:tetratricopeptide (TPR) repeat protein
MPVQASLTIAQELGDRAGVAACYHQLGMLAQDRGDYDTAEQRYQAALAINEEIGKQAGAARTLSQLGILRTDQGRAADAVATRCRALSSAPGSAWTMPPGSTCGCSASSAPR